MVRELRSYKLHGIAKEKDLRLPWWLSGGESSCQCRRCRFYPWSWKIPHVVEQLGLGATTIEPVL